MTHRVRVADKKAPVGGGKRRGGSGDCDGTIFIAGNYVAADLCSRTRGEGKNWSLARAFVVDGLVKEGHSYTTICRDKRRGAQREVVARTRRNNRLRNRTVKTINKCSSMQEETLACTPRARLRERNFIGRLSSVFLFLPESAIVQLFCISALHLSRH